MKKILIVNNNMDMGGIQKSLVNLLKSTHTDYEYTLLLFSKTGALLDEVPSDVNVITPAPAYKMLGLIRKDLKEYPFLFFTKFILIRVARLVSRRTAVKLIGIGQPHLKGYDVAISYSHLAGEKSFANGCGDFVLDKVDSKQKICLIHCDYQNSGFYSGKNNREYGEFDSIACCSESVRSRFLKMAPNLWDKTFVLRNFFDNTIEDKAYCAEETHYDSEFINIVCVARLSEEKGIDRIFRAIKESSREELRLYLVGDGPQKLQLQSLVDDLSLTRQVFFVGEVVNPYRYIQEADYLILMSYHEAAPLVFDEAHVLHTRIISSDTTSAEEMLFDTDELCATHDELVQCLAKLHKEAYIMPNSVNNELQELQLKKLIGNE